MEKALPQTGQGTGTEDTTGSWEDTERLTDTQRPPETEEWAGGRQILGKGGRGDTQ